MKKKSQKGYIQIYTGDGKGKTTAALGLALRAAGHGKKTYIAQFMKGQSYGELKSIQRIDEITIAQFGKDTFIHINQATAQDIQMARDGLDQAIHAMNSGDYQIIILDEINMAVYFKLLTVDEVLEFIKQKPVEIELILTGRRAPEQFIKIADLVTEMKEVKHYYKAGVESRDGIER